MRSTAIATHIQGLIQVEIVEGTVSVTVTRRSRTYVCYFTKYMSETPIQTIRVLRYRHPEWLFRKRFLLW